MNLLQYCFCSVFWFFGCEACVSAPQPGIKLSLPALEGEVLTTEPPGRAWLLGLDWSHLVRFDQSTENGMLLRGRGNGRKFSRTVRIRNHETSCGY